MRVDPIQPEEQARIDALKPIIERHAEHYGVDGRTVAGIIRQESHFRNERVHADGTGHGLAGLDDHGLRSDFEQWSGLTIGHGANSRVVSEDKQVEYLTKTLASDTTRFGSEAEAVRAWHTGDGGRNSRDGYSYNALINAHKAALTLAGW